MVFADAKLKNIVFTWPDVCTGQMINDKCQAVLSKGFDDFIMIMNYTVSTLGTLTWLQHNLSSAQLSPNFFIFYSFGPEPSPRF